MVQSEAPFDVIKLDVYECHQSQFLYYTNSNDAFLFHFSVLSAFPFISITEI